MAEIRETDLAGIGKRFTVDTRHGERLIIVIRDAGAVEVHTTPPDAPDRTTYVATLDDDEARQVAAIIARMLYRSEAVERLDKHGVVIRWHRLGDRAFAVGRALGEVLPQQHPGAAVIAVIDRDGERHTNPGPSYVLREGTQLAVTGTGKQVDEFIGLLESGR